MALAKERGADRRPGHPPAPGVVPHQGRDHALPRPADAHPVPQRRPARARSPAIFKIFWSEYHQEVTELALDILGADAMAPSGRWPTSSFQTDSPGAPERQRQLGRHVLNARAGTIYAGSSQIQRNIIGEMVLGLPKEPRGADQPSWREQQAAKS